ncbi:unnamed protein product [Pieris macdunnoughi]|uniref:Uncharacterized protein n=2 Tax=Pieris TaxID=7115 RepID=A0A9P0TSN6_PIEBR|nr:unnamed protein product [Pieris macdunnoughi]CAH4037097.1 unnamed protein product [Pieris brassicae]
MDPDSFMTIYGTFRRGDRPALGFQASTLVRSPSPRCKELKQGSGGFELCGVAGHVCLGGIRHLLDWGVLRPPVLYGNEI